MSWLDGCMTVCDSKEYGSVTTIDVEGGLQFWFYKYDGVPSVRKGDVMDLLDAMSKVFKIVDRNGDVTYVE